MLAGQWLLKGYREDLATGLPFVGLLLAGGWSSPLFFIPGGVAWLLGFILQRIRLRRCRCQQCGTMLYRQLRENVPVSFECASCDIIWKTRVYQDGGG